jgi:hypothetical protein
VAPRRAKINRSGTRVTVSLVGGTAGGKSTLGNLLAGRFVLPVGVQQTTTSIVELWHDGAVDGVIFSRDKDDVGALQGAEFTDDGRAREYIAQIMADDPNGSPIFARMSLGGRYRKHRIRGVGESPILEMAGLGSRVVIRDCPFFTTDPTTRRLDIVEMAVAGADILVYVFNAEQTDPTRDDELLEMLFGLLQLPGQNSCELLFVLNRKDAFYRDTAPIHAMREAVAYRRQRLQNLAADMWGLTRTPDMKIVPLAAGLAFGIELLQWRGNLLTVPDREFLKYQVANLTVPLLSERVQNVLPRSLNAWNERDWRVVNGEVRVLSGLTAFALELKAAAKRAQLRGGSVSRSLR